MINAYSSIFNGTQYTKLTFFYRLCPVSTLPVSAARAGVPLFDDLHIIAVWVIRSPFFPLSLLLFPIREKEHWLRDGQQEDQMQKKKGRSIRTSLFKSTKKKKKRLRFYFFIFSSSEVRLMDDSSVSEAMNSSILSSSKKPWKSAFGVQSQLFGDIAQQNKVGPWVAEMMDKGKSLLQCQFVCVLHLVHDPSALLFLWFALMYPQFFRWCLVCFRLVFPIPTLFSLLM